MDENYDDEDGPITEEPYKPGYKIVRKSTRKGPMQWIVKIKDPIQTEPQSEKKEASHTLHFFDEMFKEAWEVIGKRAQLWWDEMKGSSFKGEMHCFKYKYSCIKLCGSLKKESVRAGWQLTLRLSNGPYIYEDNLKSHSAPPLQQHKPGFSILAPEHDSAFPLIIAAHQIATGTLPTFFYNKEEKILEIKSWGISDEYPVNPGFAIIFEPQMPGIRCDRYTRLEVSGSTNFVKESE